MLPLPKLNEKEGFLVNGELMIVAEVEVFEVIGTFDGSEESEGAYESLCEMKLDDDMKPRLLVFTARGMIHRQGNVDWIKESIVVDGFQESVRSIFERHPHIAVGFRSKNQHLRKACMNSLLSLIETLCQSLQDLSTEDLDEADIALTYVKDLGVDWLEKKLDQVKVKKKELSGLAILQVTEKNLLNLKQKCSELDTLVEELTAVLSGLRTPLSFDDVV